MKDRDIDSQPLEMEKYRTPANSGKPAIPLAFVSLGLILAVALLVFSWNSGRHDPSDLWGAAPGSLTSVALVNGQIYYGLLQETQPGYIRLSNVYYVQSIVLADGRHENKLVNRQTNDWHAPQAMLIPIDKVVLLETVGSDSQVATLIRTDRENMSKKQ